MRTPHPQAILAAILAKRETSHSFGPYQCAALASDIARLGKTATRYGVAWCNGEQWNGQHDALCRLRLPQADYSARLSAIHAAIETQGEKLSKATEKIAARLAPFGLAITTQGDPRGHCLKIYESNDKTHDHAIWSI